MTRKLLGYRELRHQVSVRERPTAVSLSVLTHTDIDKFYAPQSLGDQTVRELETQTEWLRVLKATSSLAGRRGSPN